MSSPTASIWRWPALLTALTWFGLLDALLIDHIAARIVAWLLLAVPALLGTWITARGFGADDK